MSLPVDVRSVEVLQAVRDGFILFTEDAQNALGSMDMEVRRCIDWLTHDQRIYWQNEVKKRKEKLNEAKAELHRKQLSQMFGGHSHDSEQREGVRDAARRLEEAEEKVESVARWLPIVERAVMEYNGQARPFADQLEFEVENSIELLRQMIVAIEEYTAIAPPETNKPTMPAVSPTASAAPVVSAPTSTLLTVGGPARASAVQPAATERAAEAVEVKPDDRQGEERA